MLCTQLLSETATWYRGWKLVKLSKARSTGTHILLIDNRDRSFDADWGAWYLLCIDHGGLIGHDTSATARSFMAEPEAWCPGCQGGE